MKCMLEFTVSQRHLIVSKCKREPPILQLSWGLKEESKWLEEPERELRFPFSYSIAHADCFTEFRSLLLEVQK